MSWIVILVLAAVVLFWVVGAYNRLIALKNRVLNAWKQIDVQLKRRHDLIPNLVNTIRGAMDFERQTLEAVIAARNKAVGVQGQGVKAQGQAEGELTQALGRLFALTEAYPQLRATENIKQLQEELTSTENKIGFARQLYNDEATLYNTQQAQFPTNLVAGLAKASPAELWEIEDAAERAVPNVDLSMPPAAHGVTDANLFEQQAANKRRSTWLTVGFILFFAWIGFGGDLAWYLSTRDAVDGYRHLVPVIGIVTSLFASGVAWYSWRRGPEQILKATRATLIVEPATPDEERLVNVVEEMAIASGLPRPKVWVVPDSDPNAFATGRDPASANLAVTQGLLAALDRDELQGVVAHEMAHIKNFDVRLMTLLAGMVGAIALLSDSLRQFLRFGGRLGGRGNEKGGNPVAVVVLVLWLVTLILAPLISRLLAMAVSRKREFLADATGAQFTRNPAALAAALEKIEGATGATRSISRGAAHLCIVDPGERRLSNQEGWIGDVFASHPPMAQRVSRLKGMAYLPTNQLG